MLIIILKHKAEGLGVCPSSSAQRLWEYHFGTEGATNC